jgi:hypothetical protein
MKQSHSCKANFDSVRYNYHGAIVAIVQHLWTLYTIYCAARTDFRGKFRMRYNGIQCVTKLMSYKNANVHTLDQISLDINNVIFGTQ